METPVFVGSAAVNRGDVSRHQLATRYRPVYRDVYLHPDATLSAAMRARGAWLSTGATLVGSSAAAVHGTRWLDDSQPAEIARDNRHSQRGIVAHSWALAEDEVCLRAGMRVTTAVRTAFDVGRTRSGDDAVVVLDALLNATGIKPADVAVFAGAKAGARGVRRLREVLPLVDGGAESPRETRLRLLLVRSGLPRPQTQIQFNDLRIRVDMGWPEWKVAVEYDGIQHWADARQRSWDIERIALLEAEGWAVVRVSAEMLARPRVVLERVRDKLRAAGCPL